MEEAVWGERPRCPWAPPPPPASSSRGGWEGAPTPPQAPKQVTSGEEMKFQQTEENAKMKSDRENNEKQHGDGRLATNQRLEHPLSLNGKRKGGRGWGADSDEEWSRAAAGDSGTGVHTAPSEGPGGCSAPSAPGTADAQGAPAGSDLK